MYNSIHLKNSFFPI